MKIIPAILTSSFESIQSQVESVSEYTRVVHVDVCDGQFVQTKTWPYSNSKTGNIADNNYIKELLQEDMGLPSWDKLDYQFDLMVKNPESTIETWMRVGASTLILHPASFPSIGRFIEIAREVRAMSLYVGVAVTFDEWEKYKEELTPYLTEGEFDILQIMTIARVGAQGEPFDTRWTPILPQLVETFPDVHMQVDGGVNEKTFDVVADAGIDTALIGSGIFKDGNANENLEYFKSL